MGFALFKSLPSLGVVFVSCLIFSMNFGITAGQPRASPTPSASAISSALVSAVPNACDVNFQNTSNTELLKTIYYQVDSFSFNISHSALEVNQAVAPPSLCPNTFKSIVDGCISAQGNGFWGGWIMRDGANYSISNFAYPKNGLSNPSSAVGSIAGTSTAGASAGSSGPAPATSQSGALTFPILSLSSSLSRTSTANNQPSSQNNGPNSSPPPSSSNSGSATGPNSATASTSGLLSAPSSVQNGGSGTNAPGSSTNTGPNIPSGSSQPPASSTISNAGSSGSPPSASNGASAASIPGSSANAGTNTPSGSGQPLASSVISNVGNSGSPPSVLNGGSATNVPGSSTNAGPSSSSIQVIAPSGSGLNEQYSLASGLIATGNPTNLAIGGKTLTPGGTPYTDASNTVSLQTGGLVNVGGSTVRLLTPTASTLPTSLPGSISASSKGSASSSNVPSSSGSGSASSKGPASSNDNPPSSGGAIQGGTTSAGPGITSSPGASSTDVGIITGTITSAPPDMSTQATSNTEWTDNTWLTTQKDGQTTIVPVIVGCPNCGGLHGGIILWNLPELPKVSFQFPKFPELPPFHLPCIKVFGVTVSGDCSSPPQDDKPDNEDPDTSQDPSQTSTAGKLLPSRPDQNPRNLRAQVVAVHLPPPKSSVTAVYSAAHPAPLKLAIPPASPP